MTVSDSIDSKPEIIVNFYNQAAHNRSSVLMENDCKAVSIQVK